MFAKKKLIVVADDMGLCDCVNNGIIYSFNRGFTTEISLMMHSEGTTSALAMLKNERIHSVGIHLNLQALHNNRPISLKEYKKLLADLTGAELISAIKKELVDFEKSFGQIPTHIAPHQGLHADLRILNFLISYAKDKNVPIRIPRTSLDGGFESENYSAEVLLKRNNIQHTDHLLVEIVNTNIKLIKENFLHKLKKVKPRESVEILIHPGFFVEGLMELTSLTYERPRDISLLLDNDFKKSIKKLGFKFVPYSKL